MAIFAEITGKEWVKEGHRTRKQEFHQCCAISWKLCQIGRMLALFTRIESGVRNIARPSSQQLSSCYL